MKKAGIVGGIGPASTVDYYNGIIRGVRARSNDGNYPEIVIDSINMAEMLSLVQNKNWDALSNMLLRAIKNLADAGAGFAAIASNTPHIVFDRVQKQAALPLVSIVESTCQYAALKGCKKPMIIGTRFTMSSGLYSEAFKEYNISAAVPPEDEQELIHNIIFPKLEDGIVVPEDKAKMLEIVKRLIGEYRADALVLGCTELPLMIKDGELDVLILNTTEIHIDAIVRKMIEETTFIKN